MPMVGINPPAPAADEATRLDLKVLGGPEKLDDLPRMRNGARGTNRCTSSRDTPGS